MKFVCSRCDGTLYRRQENRITCQGCEAKYRIVKRPPALVPPPPTEQIKPFPFTTIPPRHLIVGAAVLGMAALVSYLPAPGGIELFFMFMLPLYFLPSIIAALRHHHNLAPIVVINLLFAPFFGIGWVIALAWALTSPSPVRLADGKPIG